MSQPQADGKWGEENVIQTEWRNGERNTQGREGAPNIREEEYENRSNNNGRVVNSVYRITYNDKAMKPIRTHAIHPSLVDPI